LVAVAAIALGAVAGTVVGAAGAAINTGDANIQTTQAMTAARLRPDGIQNVRALIALGAVREDFVSWFITSFPYGKLKIWA